MGCFDSNALVATATADAKTYPVDASAIGVYTLSANALHGDVMADALGHTSLDASARGISQCSAIAKGHLYLSATARSTVHLSAICAKGYRVSATAVHKGVSAKVYANDISISVSTLWPSASVTRKVIDVISFMVCPILEDLALYDNNLVIYFDNGEIMKYG